MLLGCVVKILSSRSSSCEEAKSGLIPNSFCLTVSLLIASPMVQTIKNLPAMSGTWVQPLGQEDPLGKGMTTHSSTPAWEYGQRRLASYSPRGRKDLDTTERLTHITFFGRSLIFPILYSANKSFAIFY